MRAIAITQPGGPEVLQLVDRPIPEPARGEVRVRVRATAINRADLLQRAGGYPAPFGDPADIPGLELSGEVEAVGPFVERLKVGDRVFGLVGGGAYAEYITAHERTLAIVPDGITLDDAAAIPEAFITAYDAIRQGELRGGEALLVHAVGSGVGTAAAQLGRALGAFVIGTARTADKLERAKKLGMDHGIAVTDGTFATEVNRVVPGGAAVTLELVGGAYLNEDLKATRPKGTIVLIGLLAGARAELELGLVLRKRLQVRGTVLRARPLEEKIAAMRTFETEVVPLLARGKVAPVIDRVMKLEDAAEAHRYVATNAGFGKVVLSVS